MTSGDAISAFVYFAPWAIVIGGFVGRNWIKAELEKGIQHRFDQRLEKLRGELRKSEEHLKAELRKKESEISALRGTILSGHAARQALLDKRRFDAVEKVWTSVNDMAKLKSLSSTMAVLNFKAVAARADDPKMQKFLDIVGASAPEIADLKNVARDERPFLPELAWAYFNAYSQILVMSLARFRILKIGMKDAGDFLKDEPLQKILKAVLPHHSDWIDRNEAGLYHYLLDEIETLLLNELRKILDGTEVDKAAAAKANGILKALEDADQLGLKDKLTESGLSEDDVLNSTPRLSVS
jgi:hypothetical protein